MPENANGYTVTDAAAAAAIVFVVDITISKIVRRKNIGFELS